MQQVEVMINQYLVYILGGLVGFILILFICFIMQSRKLKRIQMRYEKFMQKEEVDLENLLIHYAKKVNTLQNDQEITNRTIEAMKKQMTLCVQKVGVVRYNAIERVGADLSFAIALLDEKNDGVVLNGIYSRDGSYTYAKPIQNGESKYTLSQEELEALKKARQD
jgi:hypothetical protein